MSGRKNYPVTINELEPLLQNLRDSLQNEQNRKLNALKKSVSENIAKNP